MLTTEHLGLNSIQYRGFKTLNGNCPICLGQRRDCRKNTTNNLVHCRYDVDFVSGYKLVGQDRIGFNMWATEAESELRNNSFTKYRQNYQTAARTRSKQQANTLTIDDRDREIRRLIAQLNLTKFHKHSLLARGLDELAIVKGQFRSVRAWQTVHNISPNLAGIDENGQKLLISQDGIICPIWDVQQNLIGWQTRFDDPGKQGKYRWPTSRNANQPNGATAHLPNGELPLTCCRPIELSLAQSAIGLAEGFLKPFIAAQKLQQVIIGAAGGNFAASSQTLKNYLEALAPELNTRLVQIYPDAGAIANFNVLQQYQKTIQLLQQWQFDVEVAWWGQSLKDTDPDIDEIDHEQRQQIIYITPEEFWQLCPPEIQVKLTATNHKQNLELIHGLKLWWQRLRKHFKQPKGFGRIAEPTPKIIPPVIHYTPGAIPKRSECSQPPQIIFKAGQRLQVLMEAIAAGWQHLLDTSITGTSKSHDAGEATPTMLGTRQLFYLSPQHRNPTVATVERNFQDLPVRHNGLKQDFNRTTPLGAPYRQWPKAHEVADVQGNCFRTPLFAALRQKNLPSIETADNPICGTCHLMGACRNNSGQGYGFKFERHKALTSDRVRAHPDSAPDLSYDWQNIGVFWDEVLQTLKPTHTITAKLSDIDAAIAVLATERQDLYLPLHKAFTAIRQRVSGHLPQPYYGWNDQAVREALGEIPEAIATAIDAIQTVLKPDLSWLQPPDGINVGEIPNLTASEKSLLYRASDQLRQQDYREAQISAETKVLLNWLVPFLTVWSKQAAGALRIEMGKLIVTTRNDRHSAIARAAKWNCYQDATANVEHLSLWLGIEPQEILTITQATPNHRNLEIIHVTGLGKVGKNRSEFCTVRVNALKQELQERHQNDIGFIDWKAASSVGDGAWFVNSRGSNEFQNVGAIASFGVPYSNIGELESRFITLTGQAINEQNSETFQAFVQQITDAEIIQAVGRLRSHLRPQQQLKFYFCADYDLPEIPQAGKLTTIKASELTIAAADKVEQALHALESACRTLWANSQKITQQALSELSGLSQGYISKLVADLGGWQEWKKLFLSLLKASYSKRNNFELPNSSIDHLLVTPDWQSDRPSDSNVSDCQNIDIDLGTTHLYIGKKPTQQADISDSTQGGKGKLSFRLGFWQNWQGNSRAQIAKSHDIQKVCLNRGGLLAHQPIANAMQQYIFELISWQISRKKRVWARAYTKKTKNKCSCRSYYLPKMAIAINELPRIILSGIGASVMPESKAIAKARLPNKAKMARELLNWWKKNLSSALTVEPIEFFFHTRLPDVFSVEAPACGVYW